MLRYMMKEVDVQWYELSLHDPRRIVAIELTKSTYYSIIFFFVNQIFLPIEVDQVDQLN